MATQVIFKQGGFLMVTTIGIDPHKATHTAVAIDGSEKVLAEITISADRYQTKKLIDWASGLNGDGRLWAVEAAGGLGYLLSQQLVAGGEHVVDVPMVLASRVRVLGSGKSDKNDPNDARSVAIAALRQPGLPVVRFGIGSRRVSRNGRSAAGWAGHRQQFGLICWVRGFVDQCRVLSGLRFGCR